MYFFGMLQEGHCGVEATNVELTKDDIAGYGVDWDALDDPQIQAHHLTTNYDIDDQIHIPLPQNTPEHFAIVEVNKPNCPLTAKQIFYLDSQLATHGSINSHTVKAYRLRWISALALCMEMFVL
jgi:hypothetical protein